MSLAPHPFSLRQLQYAQAVAETLSFRAAAARCRVSQPALSAQLAELERGLGVRLFERDRRRVLPTAAGNELLERARRVLTEVEALRAAARTMGDPLAATLRLGVIPTIAPYLIPRLAPRLASDLPRLTALWIEDKTEALEARLADGGIDAALLASRPTGAGTVAEALGRDPFLLAYARGQDPPAALDQARLLLLDDGHCLRDQALAVCARARARPDSFRATSLATLAAMVAAGVGATLLPALALPTERVRSRLAVRPLADPRAVRELVLVRRSGSPYGAALGALAGLARDCIAALVAEAGSMARARRV